MFALLKTEEGRFGISCYHLNKNNKVNESSTSQKNNPQPPNKMGGPLEMEI